MNLFIVNFFKTGADLPLIEDKARIRELYEKKRFFVFLWLIIGYGFFYTCRLSFNVARKSMADAGVLEVHEIGIVGATLKYVYAFGKCANGFLSDRANIRRFMSSALLCSAIINLIMGAVSSFWLFLALWAVNGWFQSIGSAPSVVSICQWYSHKERGRRYGIWAGAHNLGEGMTFLGTAAAIGWFGWRAGFVFPGLACALVALILFRMLADRPQTYGLPHVSDYNEDYTGGKPSTESVAQEQLKVLKHPMVWVLAFSSGLMYVARYAINDWGVFYLEAKKGYDVIEAGAVMAPYPIVGFLGAVLSGWISEKFFKSRRNVPTLIYGVMTTFSIVLLWRVPPGHFMLDMLAMGIFGFGIGGLIVFLAGLTAVDIMPKKATGAVKGVIGLVSYLMAATQDWVSGYLMKFGTTIVDGEEVINFDYAFYFWIGASILSIFLALFAWNAKPHE